MAYRHHYRRRSNSNGFGMKSLQVGLLILLVAGPTFLRNKDAFYVDNGKGGEGWKIGAPKASVFDGFSSKTLPEVRQFALSLVNRDRQINGLPPLVEDPLMSQASQNHSQDMLTRKYYSHITPEGKTPTDRFAMVGGRGGVGENIMEQTGATGVSLNYRLIEEFQKGWMYSTGHRQNLLDPSYTRFGYGIVTEAMSGRAYAVQTFARPEQQ